MIKLKSNSGLTLLELLVVIIIIGILAAILVPAMTTRGRESQGSVALSNLPYLATAINTEISTGTMDAPTIAGHINGDAAAEPEIGGYTVSDQDTYWNYNYNDAAGTIVATHITVAGITVTYTFSSGDTTFSDATYDPRT